jgi:hypothetical protein
MWLPRGKNRHNSLIFGIPNAGFGEGERDAVASFSFLFLGTTLLLLAIFVFGSSSGIYLDSCFLNDYSSVASYRQSNLQQPHQINSFIGSFTNRTKDTYKTLQHGSQQPLPTLPTTSIPRPRSQHHLHHNKKPQHQKPLPQIPSLRSPLPRRTEYISPSPTTREMVADAARTRYKGRHDDGKTAC